MVEVVGVHGVGNYSYFRSTGTAEAAALAAGAEWSSWLAGGGHAAPDVRHQ